MSGVDLGAVTVETFAPLTGEPFALRADGAPELALELLEARSLPDAQRPAADGRQPFALIFGGPAEPLLAQQIVPLEHAALGRLELFLVPIARDADGARYEAVFS